MYDLRRKISFQPRHPDTLYGPLTLSQKILLSVFPELCKTAFIARSLRRYDAHDGQNRVAVHHLIENGKLHNDAWGIFPEQIDG